MWSSVRNYATRFLATIGARWAKPVEPRTEVIAEEVILPAFHEAQFMPLIAANDSVSVANGPAFSPAKRQYCDPGWGYCSCKFRVHLVWKLWPSNNVQYLTGVVPPTIGAAEAVTVSRPGASAVTTTSARQGKPAAGKTTAAPLGASAAKMANTAKPVTFACS
jgi:hypothetical protein